MLGDKYILGAHKRCHQGMDWLVGWEIGFYGISTLVDYLMTNPFLYK